jgi:hypothetical protein
MGISSSGGGGAEVGDEVEPARGCVRARCEGDALRRARSGVADAGGVAAGDVSAGGVVDAGGVLAAGIVVAGGVTDGGVAVVASGNVVAGCSDCFSGRGTAVPVEGVVSLSDFGTVRPTSRSCGGISHTIETPINTTHAVANPPSQAFLELPPSNQRHPLARRGFGPGAAAGAPAVSVAAPAGAFAPRAAACLPAAPGLRASAAAAPSASAASVAVRVASTSFCP